jgi:hypothetical protein
MPSFELNLSIDNNNERNKLRMSVVEQLSKELCGKGKGEMATRYIYYVETLSDSNRIYLKRPAWLYNGFDFLVCVENINFNPTGRYRNYPSHSDIFKDLRNKKKENDTLYKKLYVLMNDAFDCKTVDLKKVSEIKFNSGYPCDLIIGSIKWLFIEQDIRFWNYSGRKMFWNGIMNI